MITHQQNNALHLYFRRVAEALADAGFDCRELLVEIRPTEYIVKENMWKPIEQALYGKVSTQELTSTELDHVYDHLNAALSDKFGIHIPFPDEIARYDDRMAGAEHGGGTISEK